jgi:hypothetical protein
LTKVFFHAAERGRKGARGRDAEQGDERAVCVQHRRRRSVVVVHRRPGIWASSSFAPPEQQQHLLQEKVKKLS